MKNSSDSLREQIHNRYDLIAKLMKLQDLERNWIKQLIRKMLLHIVLVALNLAILLLLLTICSCTLFPTPLFPAPSSSLLWNVISAFPALISRDSRCSALKYNSRYASLACIRSWKQPHACNEQTNWEWSLSGCEKQGFVAVFQREMVVAVISPIARVPSRCPSEASYPLYRSRGLAGTAKTKRNYFTWLVDARNGSRASLKLTLHRCLLIILFLLFFSSSLLQIKLFFVHIFPSYFYLNTNHFDARTYSEKSVLIGQEYLQLTWRKKRSSICRLWPNLSWITTSQKVFINHWWEREPAKLIWSKDDVCAPSDRDCGSRNE